MFPPIGSNNSLKFLNLCFKSFKKTFGINNNPWLFKKTKKDHKVIPNKIPDDGINPNKIIVGSIENFLPNAPNWRSPYLYYNICAPVNAVSQALLSLSQEINIHNINTDFAGGCLHAEKIISEMMADLIDLSIDNVGSLFSFGGTASNMYAMKLAINKAAYFARRDGVPSNLYVMVTDNAHFSHKTIGDWLGIGTDRLIQIKTDKHSRSIVKDAEFKAKSIFKEGGIVAGFLLNGGPFYDFAIDDINSFVELRNDLVKEFNLSFSPHIHVDSVIGWVWLMFSGYDFDLNPLKIPSSTLCAIRKQFNRIYQVRNADSWGVDFHKGLGGCPVPCGLFVSNNKKDLLLLSKKFCGIETHHLGGDWSLDDPSDITLETSRSAGAPLAALGSVLSMGKNGFRLFLSNQIFYTKIFRNLLLNDPNFLIGNFNSLGFNTMVLVNPNRENISWNEFINIIKKDKNILKQANRMTREFYEFCLKGDRLGCSFSGSFYRVGNKGSLSGLKYCFVSPYIDLNSVENEVKKLKRQIKFFLKINERNK